MSDAELRRLELAWRETGSTEDEAEWLRARVRAGVLSDDRLRLAAEVGNEAACRVLGLTHSVPDETFLSREAIDELFSRIARFGGEAASRRASIAVCTLIDEDPADLLEAPGAHVAHWFDHAYSWFYNREHCELASRVWAELPEQAARYAGADEQTQDRILAEARRVATRIVRKQVSEFVAPWSLGSGDPAGPGLVEFED